jgi:hypothetical protein
MGAQAIVHRAQAIVHRAQATVHRAQAMFNRRLEGAEFDPDLHD